MLSCPREVCWDQEMQKKYCAKRPGSRAVDDLGMIPAASRLTYVPRERQ